jgi:hypothetical protein
MGILWGFVNTCWHHQRLLTEKGKNHIVKYNILGEPMTKARLEGLPIEALNNLLDRQNIQLAADAGKSEIIEALLESFEEDREEKEKRHNLIIKIEEAKFAISQDEDVEFIIDEEILVPDYYDETYIHIMPRDPSWCFAYWEVKKSLTQVLEKEWGFKELFLRVFELDGPNFQEKKTYSYLDIPIKLTYGSRYISLPTPNNYYIVEIRARMEEGERFLARSGVFLTPPAEPPYEEIRGPKKEQIEKLLKLSGLDTCEPNREDSNRSEDEDSNPHRIGLMEDEDLFDEESEEKKDA